MAVSGLNPGTAMTIRENEVSEPGYPASLGLDHRFYLANTIDAPTAMSEKPTMVLIVGSSPNQK